MTEAIEVFWASLALSVLGRLARGEAGRDGGSRAPLMVLVVVAASAGGGVVSLVMI